MTMKWCPKCDRGLTIIVNVTFNKKMAASDELQPWCRECDHRNKLRQANGWPRFLYALKRQTPPLDHLWTQRRYLALMEERDWKCRWCGAEVAAWSGGYWVDRIDPKRGYYPDNCIACCWPCNREKSDRHAAEFDGYVKEKVEKYGPGRVPWQLVSPRHKRADGSIPDLSQYVEMPARHDRLPSPQIPLFESREWLDRDGNEK